jgi:hypothetical protein
MGDISEVVDSSVVNQPINIRACACKVVELDGFLQHLSKPYLDQRFPEGYQFSHTPLSVRCAEKYYGDAWDKEFASLCKYQSCPKPVTSQETS